MGVGMSHMLMSMHLPADEYKNDPRNPNRGKSDH